MSRVHTTLYVTQSVRRSVGRSRSAKTLKGGLTCVTAPAHPYATDAVVYGLVKIIKTKSRDICSFEGVNFFAPDRVTF